MESHPNRAFEDVRNTVNEYARILRQRWRLALIGVGVVGSATFWCSQYLPHQYHATTLFERRDDAVLRNLIQDNSPYSFDNLRSSIRLDMTGMRALADAAVTVGILPGDSVSSVGVLSDQEMKALDDALTRYNFSASVSMIQSSSGLDTIELACEASDPDIARRFAIALRDQYLLQTRDRIAGILSSTKRFFELQAHRFHEQAAETNSELERRFKEFPGVDPLNPPSAGSRLEALRLERGRLLQRKEELAAQISAREQFLVAEPTYITAPVESPQDSSPAPLPPGWPETDVAVSRAIREVEQEIADAITVRRMTLEHPTVKMLYRKLEGLHAAREAILQAAATQGADPADPESARAREAYRQWKAQQLRVELELDALRRQMEVVQNHFDEADARVQRFAQLYNELLSDTGELRTLQDRLDQNVATVGVWRQYLAQLNRILAAESGQRGTQFTLIEEPKRTSRPVTPRVASVFPVCTGFGLAAAALLVALAELFDRSFRSAGQVTRVLGIPVLECVGVIPTPKERRRRRFARLVWTPTLGLLVLCLMATSSLAYTSLVRPELHRQAIKKLDRVLTAINVPPTRLGDDPSR